MKKFRIEATSTEITTVIYFVEAESEKEAIEKWENDSGEPFATYEKDAFEEMESIREGDESEEDTEEGEENESDNEEE